MFEKYGEVRVAKNVRCKNGCAVSSIGKVGSLFGFNDSIKPLVYK